MNIEEFKNLICSIKIENFVEWYNDYIVDPFGDFWYQIIRRNDEEEIYNWVKDNLDLEAFIKICKDAKYSEDDDWVILRDEGIISFNTVAIFLEKECLEYMYDIFCENEEYSLEIFNK